MLAGAVVFTLGAGAVFSGFRSVLAGAEELRNSEWIAGLPGSENVYLSIDGRLVDYFRKSGKGYLNRLNIAVNSALREYINSHMEGVMQ